MTPTTQSSPLSLGPPSRLLPRPARLLTKPSAQRSRLQSSSSPVALRARYSTSAIVTPPVVSNTNVLAEYLKSRHADYLQGKVIAVDGLDREAVQAVVTELHYNITRDFRCSVRVLHEGIPQPPVDATAEMARFLGQIQDWSAMWEVILRASPPALRPKFQSDQNRADDMDGDIPSVVWIIPLSPLMATTRALTGIALTGSYNAADLWRWLASHWNGHFRPDVTINVQEIADVCTKREVLRFESNKMNTLLLTTSRVNGIDITSRQLRRAVFEVKEWIRGDA